MSCHFQLSLERRERGFRTRCEFPRTSQTRRGYLKPNPATTRSLVLPFYMPGLLLSYFASLCLSTYKFQTGCISPRFTRNSGQNLSLEYQTSVMSLRYSIAFLTHMIGSSTTRHTHTHTPQSRGLKQQQLFSWHRAGALWFLEQVDYLTSSEYPYF